MSLQSWIAAEVAKCATEELASALKEAPASSGPSSSSATYCIEAIQRILGNRAWKDELANYPPFLTAFWSTSGLAGVPKEVLGIYEADAARKMAQALASENLRNVKRKLAKAAANAKGAR
jgi:hypothetical protein